MCERTLSNFCQFPNPEDPAEESVVESLTPVYDPEPVDAINQQFIARIKQIIAETAKHRAFGCPRASIPLAEEVLDLLRESANQDHGIGVDEYDFAALKAPSRKTRYKVDFNTREPRRRLNEHLLERYRTTPATVKWAMSTLRDSTRQALHEGWLL
jgi:hypothetical protein